MWWNVTFCIPLCGDGLYCTAYGWCVHVSAVACASAHGLLLVSAIFSHLFFCPFPSLPSLTCYLWSVPSSHTGNTLHLWWDTPSFGLKVMLHSSSRICKYFWHLSSVADSLLLCFSFTMCSSLTLTFELQWLLWWWHPGFALCWAAYQNCILLKLSRLHQWMSVDPELQYTSCILTGFSAIVVLCFIGIWHVSKLPAAVASLHFSVYSGRPRSPCTSCL